LGCQQLDGLLNGNNKNSGTQSTPTYGNLIVLYDFNESAGSVILDKTGNGNNATANMISRIAGKDGGAVQFAVAGSYISVPFPFPGLDVNAISQLSFQFWIRPNSSHITESQFIFGDRDNLDLSIDLIGQKASISWNNTQVLQTTSVIQPSVWTLVDFVVDGTGTKVYINGSLDASTSIIMPTRFNTGYYSIGARQVGFSYTNQYYGDLDELYFYQSALSPQTISDYYTTH
jgi:hypothetical protein